MVEGSAEANMGHDPAEQADVRKDGWERGNGFTLRQLTGADWYHRHQVLVSIHGAPLVDFLLRRFGPIRDEEFDPDRFLDGPRAIRAEPEAFVGQPSVSSRPTWPSFAIGAVGLVAGAAIAIGTRPGPVEKTPTT